MWRVWVSIAMCIFPDEARASAWNSGVFVVERLMPDACRAAIGSLPLVQYSDTNFFSFDF